MTLSQWTSILHTKYTIKALAMYKKNTLMIQSYMEE